MEYYWNQYWCHNKSIRGSVASWIIRNIVQDTGGFYQRITYRLELKPFNLKKTKLFLKKQGVHLNHQQILSLYMVTGGVPLYLEKIKKGLSADQNIDQLCFQDNAFLFDELNSLMNSLFKNASIYLRIIKAIGKHQYGISQVSLATQLKISQSGSLTEKLENLARQKGHWLKQAKTPTFKAWSGYVFESICYKHLPEILNRCQLAHHATPHTWRYSPKAGAKEKGAQIDLLLDREDTAITIFEIKNQSGPLTTDKSMAENLQNKRDIFKNITRTQKQIFLSVISASGIKKTIYSEELITDVVTLDDLFT